MQPREPPFVIRSPPPRPPGEAPAGPVVPAMQITYLVPRAVLSQVLYRPCTMMDRSTRACEDRQAPGEAPQAQVGDVPVSCSRSPTRPGALSARF
jgi:hypothetical protein